MEDLQNGLPGALVRGLVTGAIATGIVPVQNQHRCMVDCLATETIKHRWNVISKLNVQVSILVFDYFSASLKEQTVQCRSNLRLMTSVFLPCFDMFLGLACCPAAKVNFWVVQCTYLTHSCIMHR